MSVQSVIRSAAPRGVGSPTDTVHRADTLADLTRIFVPETQICVHSPPGNPDMLDALAGLRASGWSGLRAVVRISAEGVPDIDAVPLPPAFAHPALRRELAFLLELYGDLLGCAAIGLRIERLERAMCPGWHVDRTGIRMLCTWCGPGTEWLDDPGIDPRGLPGSAANALATGQARPFDIVLLKGTAWQGNVAGGAIHLRIPRHSATCSTNIRPAIPRPFGHRFHSHSAGAVGAKRRRRVIVTRRVRSASTFGRGVCASTRL